MIYLIWNIYRPHKLSNLALNHYGSSYLPFHQFVNVSNIVSLMQISQIFKYPTFIDLFSENKSQRLHRMIICDHIYIHHNPHHLHNPNQSTSQMEMHDLTAKNKAIDESHRWAPHFPSGCLKYRPCHDVAEVKYLWNGQNYLHRRLYVCPVHNTFMWSRISREANRLAKSHDLVGFTAKI